MLGGQPEIVISPRLLIRLHRNQKPNEGPLDEVVTHDENGECDFHLEQMDDFQWWMRWYSTKARPLPRELIVHIGPSGAFQEFDSPRDFSDEKYTPPEYQTPPESIPQQIDHFMRYFGMKRTLEEMIANIAKSKQDEKTNWPDRDTSYLDKLVEDLTMTLKNYEGRYPGEPDYNAGEPKDLRDLVLSHLEGVYKGSKLRPADKKVEDEVDDIVEEIEKKFGNAISDQSMFDAWMEQQKQELQ